MLNIQIFTVAASLYVTCGAAPQEHAAASCASSKQASSDEASLLHVADDFPQQTSSATDEVSLAQLRLDVMRRQTRVGCLEFGGPFPKTSWVTKNNKLVLGYNELDNIMQEWITQEETQSSRWMAAIEVVHGIQQLQEDQPLMSLFTELGTMASNSRIMSSDLRKVHCQPGGSPAGFVGTFKRDFANFQEPFLHYFAQYSTRYAELKLLMRNNPGLDHTVETELKKLTGFRRLQPILMSPLQAATNYQGWLIKLREAMETLKLSKDRVPENLPEAEREVDSALQAGEIMSTKYALIQLQELFPEEHVFALHRKVTPRRQKFAMTNPSVAMENAGYGILASTWEPQQFLLCNDVMYIWSASTPLTQVRVQDIAGVSDESQEAEPVVVDILLKPGVESTLAEDMNGRNAVRFQVASQQDAKKWRTWIMEAVKKEDWKTGGLQ